MVVRKTICHWSLVLNMPWQIECMHPSGPIMNLINKPVSLVPKLLLQMGEKISWSIKLLRQNFVRDSIFFANLLVFCDYSNLLNITPPRLHPSFLFSFLFLSSPSTHSTVYLTPAMYQVHRQTAQGMQTRPCLQEVHSQAESMMLHPLRSRHQHSNVPTLRSATLGVSHDASVPSQIHFFTGLESFKLANKLF